MEMGPGEEGGDVGGGGGRAAPSPKGTLILELIL